MIVENVNDPQPHATGGEVKHLKSHCTNGHPFLPGSYYQYTDRTWLKRVCKQCHKLRMKKVWKENNNTLVKRVENRFRYRKIAYYYTTKRYYRFNKPLDAVIQELVDKGWTAPQIAKLCRVGKQTMYQWFKKFNIHVVRGHGGEYQEYRAA